MIAGLTGIVVESVPGHVVLDVGGVSYLVFCSHHTLARLPRPGEEVRLRIEMLMREDGIALYGFADREEQACFRQLQTVQGVGAKMALAVLGTLTPGELHAALEIKDEAALARAPGIGSKLARRIVTELGGRTVAASPSESPRHREIVSGLTNLGYSAPEAREAARAALSARPDGTAAELLRNALRIIAGRTPG